MSLSDRIISVLALACFAFSLAVLGYFVPDMDLVAVLVLVFGMAVYDFFFYRQRRT